MSIYPRYVVRQRRIALVITTVIGFLFYLGVLWLWPMAPLAERMAEWPLPYLPWMPDYMLLDAACFGLTFGGLCFAWTNVAHLESASSELDTRRTVKLLLGIATGAGCLLSIGAAFMAGAYPGMTAFIIGFAGSMALIFSVAASIIACQLVVRLIRTLFRYTRNWQLLKMAARWLRAEDVPEKPASIKQ